MPRIPRSRPLATALLALIAGLAPTRGEEPRRPEALLLIDGGSRLLVANRGTGTVAVVDAKGRRVEEEVAIGRGLSDLRATADPDVWLAVDQEAGEVVRIVRRGGTIARLDAVRVADDPTRAVVHGDGRRAMVVSRWSRRATFVEWGATDALCAVAAVDLPFSPREAAVLPGGSEAVATDAFGGRLALVDLDAMVVRRVLTLPDHNLRAPTITPDGLGVAILAQNGVPRANTSRQDVEWGLVMRSWIRVVRLDDLRSPGATDADLVANSRIIVLGTVGKGSADPSALAFGPRGEAVVSMAGTDQVASALALGEPYERFSVGRAPVALAIDAEAATAYTADRFDDALTVVDLTAGKLAGVVALSAAAGIDGRRRPATLLEEGESLFRDARVSEDGWMSCHTCHADGHASDVLTDTMTDGSYGAAKRSPSLLGIADTAPFGWTGASRRLQDQIHTSITTTMRGHEPAPRQIEALAAYLRSLDPPRPEPVADADAVARGRAIFESNGCADCHAPPAYTTRGSYDVGLVDAVGNREFNPPSLRGVGRRPALLHDASVMSLPDLFRQARHPDGGELTDAEIADLASFLRSL
ncbi:cytochrome c peroxidase [Paludisphaera sp.]|uniref:cytochrome c peroxidase n=1 Tax=Paludisphaera sp. TaxID=2017432 RepID=UPI00301C07A7